MRYAEIRPDVRAPASHPYVATIEVNPVDCDRTTRFIKEAPELRLLRRLDDKADRCVFFIGCASRRVRAGIEDDWR